MLYKRLGECILFWVRNAVRGYLGLKMQDLCMYSFWDVYTYFPHIKALFYCVTNGSSMKVISCVPFLPFLGGVPVWVGSVGSVFWDCSWGCQGVNREEKGDQNKIWKEERGKRRLKWDEKHERAVWIKNENVCPSVSCLYLFKMILL